MAAAPYSNKEWMERPHRFIPPRTKMALKLYVSGAVRTQREAAEIAGVTQATVSNARRSLNGKAYEESFDSQVMERAVSLSAVIAKLSEKALNVMEEQILHGTTEEVKFKAAKDILDRNPETSKTNKIQVESFTLSGRDAKELAAALAEGRMASHLDAEVSSGDFVKIEEVPVRPSLMGAIADELVSGKGTSDYSANRHWPLGLRPDEGAEEGK